MGGPALVQPRTSSRMRPASARQGVRASRSSPGKNLARVAVGIGADLLAFGGAGSDRIEASTASGDSAMIFGDAGTAAFDIGASGRLEQLNTLADASGGSFAFGITRSCASLF